MEFESGVRSIRGQISWVALIAWSALAACTSSLGADQPRRALRLDDFNAEERITPQGNWSVAGDGALAIGIDRAPNTRSDWSARSSDVWVRLAPDRPLVNITNGQADGGDWRDPLWSPDGRRLVLQSTRGHKRSLWLWTRDTGELSALTTRAFADTKAYYEWLDSRRVICTVLPPDLQAEEFFSDSEAIASAKAGWAQFRAGNEPSVSVLDPAAEARAARPKSDRFFEARFLRQIISIDVETHATKLITDPYRPGDYAFFAPSLSPDGKFIALMVYGAPVSGSYSDAMGTDQLTIYRTDGGAVKFANPLPGDALTTAAARWSADSSRLAFFAYGKSRAEGARLFVADAVHGGVESHSLGDTAVTVMRDRQWDYAKVEWTETGELVYFAGQGEHALEKFARRDWWLIRKSEAPLKLTGDLKTVPEFDRVSTAGPLVGLVDGFLWWLDAKHRAVRKITMRGTPLAPRLVWPKNPMQTARTSFDRSYVIRREQRPARSAVVVESSNESASAHHHYYYVDIDTGQVTELKPPSPELVVARLDQALKTVYWVNKTALDFPGTASSLWLADTSPAQHGDSRQPVVALNRWHENIQTSAGLEIDYTSLDGQRARGWIQLPVSYQPGRRYPLIVYVYPGQQGVGGQSGFHYDELAPAAGFAVLRPQMSFTSGRMYAMTTRDVYFEVSNGVLPAVERAVALGIADPDRLLVEGHSMGGFATISLLQQSARFKAGLANAGEYDWSSSWGTFAATGRYGDDIASLDIGFAGENIQQRPATQTPWSDSSLYQRNSPITYVERVRAPVLLVHGDQDANVSMTQTEELFSALLRLGKKVSFVRYWGEKHVLESPANIRDLWQRRLSWFDEFADIARDSAGHMLFEGDRVRSRGGAAALRPADYEHFEFFQPGGAKADADRQ